NRCCPSCRSRPRGWRGCRRPTMSSTTTGSVSKICGPKYFNWPRIWGYDLFNVITYEYPFNERIRTFLRLENLFARLRGMVGRDDALDHHYALVCLFEVMDVGARADLKADLLRDLDKQRQLLGSYRGNPNIAQDVLDQVLQQVEQCHAQLSG